MADEAFALSPISARAAMPSEADYDAIREAFMETSRGRWFLTEYAKRNRNADTTMVLDAVARIEQTLAAQKQATADDGLAKALAAIRSSLEEAKALAAKALTDPSRDDAIAPIQKGVRIIREISWRWREIGGDGRICDLLDSQATAIEGASAQLAARDDAAALEAAFGLIETTLDDLSGASAAAFHASPAESAMPSATSEAPASPAAKVAPEQPPATADALAPQVEATPVAETDKDAADAMMTQDQAESTSTTAVNDEDMAHDDAVLDMIAMEMGAPDPDEPQVDEAAGIEPVSAEPETTSEPETLAESAEASIAPEATVGIESSLGASLLASGIVTRTPPPRSDPLAPIRRMTQAEKIAFFS